MKKITFIAILLLCICSLTKAKEKVIEQPPFIAWTSTSIGQSCSQRHSYGALYQSILSSQAMDQDFRTKFPEGQ